MSVGYFLLGLICEGWERMLKVVAEICVGGHGEQGAFKNYMEEIWAWLWAVVKKLLRRERMLVVFAQFSTHSISLYEYLAVWHCFYKLWSLLLKVFVGEV